MTELMDDDEPVKGNAEVPGTSPTAQVAPPSTTLEPVSASPAKIASIFLKPQPKPKSSIKAAASSPIVDTAPPAASSSSPLVAKGRPGKKSVVEDDDDDDDDEIEEDDRGKESSKPSRVKKPRGEVHQKVRPSPERTPPMILPVACTG